MLLAAYLRDSGGDKQDLSIPQQRTAILAWAVENDHLVDRWFVDEARPGSSTIGRDGFLAMMDHFRDHDCPEAGLVVWRMSRFSRDIDDAQFYKADLRRRGYHIYSISDNLPDGPEGRFYEAALDWMNQRFLVDLSRDVQRGLHSLVQEYGAVPGTPPHGFTRQPLQIGLHRNGQPRLVHRWVPDPDLVPLVRQAFELKAAGCSHHQINQAVHLYTTLNSYTKFFSNPLYIGELHYAGLVVEHYCEPIVDRPTWDNVQARLKTAQPVHPRRASSSYLLSGLAYCSLCNSPLYGMTSGQKVGKPYERYNCTRANRRRDCPARPIPRKALTSAVLDTLSAFILDPRNLQTLQAEYAGDFSAKMSQLKQQRAVQRTRLADLHRQQTNITLAIADAGHSRSLLARLADLENQEAEILAHLARIDDQVSHPPPELTYSELEALANRTRDMLLTQTVSEQRQILRGIIYRINVRREGKQVEGEIVYYFPSSDKKKLRV